MFQVNRNNQQHRTEGDFEGPLLNEYKKKFVFNRILQTVFGGCLLRFDYKVPFYVYLSQIVLYVLPFLFGGIGILIKDLNTSISSLYVCLVTAALFCFCIIFIKILMKLFVSRSKNEKKQQKTSILAEEDLLEFDDSESCVNNCCTFDKISYLMPNILNITINESNKCLNIFLIIVKLVVDSSISFFIIFSSVYFLSITYLTNFYQLGGAIVVFILSWIVVCISLYSLLIREPFEIAAYNNNLNDIKYLSRSFYVCCFFIIECIYNFQSGTINSSVIYWIKLIFLTLPVLWSFGTLPPIDALFVHLIEQSFIHLFGGSATSSYSRLLFQILLSATLSMVYFIPNDTLTVALLSVFGYLLSSVDLTRIVLLVKEKIVNKRNKIETISSDQFARISSLNWPLNETNKKEVDLERNNVFIKELVYHVLMIISTITCSMLIFNLFQNLEKTIRLQIQIALLYTCIGLLIIISIFSRLQNVYLFFGLIRNPLYPKSCLNEIVDTDYDLTINRRKLIFQILKFIRISLLKFVSPLLLCAVVTIDCVNNGIYNDSTFGYMRTLFVLRAYRWIWQSTYNCLFEMAFMAHLLLLVILYNTNSSLQASLIQNYLPACMAASFVYDRIKQFVNKLYAFILITTTSWTLKTQRNKLAKGFIILNFILFIPYILPVIVISSILSAPLLPLFTFPIFLIGFPRAKRFWPQQQTFEPGKAIVNTANRDSYFYSQITPHLLKSLQECILSGSLGSSVQPDTFFITRFQDRIIWIQILESSGTYCLVSVKGLELQETSCHTREAQYIDDSFEATFENGNKINQNKFDCLKPCDVLILKTYSDAKNTLVGILDSPDCVKQICEFYPKVLHFFLLKYLLKNQNVNKDEPLKIMNSEAKLQADPIKLISKSENMKPNHRLSPIQQRTNELPDINQTTKQRKLEDALPEWSDTDSLFDDLYNENNKKNKIKNIPKTETKNLNKSDDFDASIFDIIPDKKNNFELKTNLKNIQNFEYDDGDQNGDVSSNSILSIPLKWINLLKKVEVKQNDEFIRNSRSTITAVNWLNKLMEANDKTNLNQNDSLANDYKNNFSSSHFNFLMKCSTCLGLRGSSGLSAQSMYKLYKGELPWSQVTDQIKKEANDLNLLLTKAFCYTIKLVIDSLTIVPCENDDDLIESLKSYENEWFIGSENEPDYALSLQSEKPFIFTLFDDRDKKTVNSRTLTLKNIVSPICRLNNEIIKSIWSSTNLELLYMTNDDDERYSIQAHQFILRNITIQASDPPLGYPIFISEPIYVSTCF